MPFEGTMQVGTKLRRAPDRYFHFCPACSQMHALPDKGWSFNGDVESPTFLPSFKHEWNEGDEKKICHYVLTAGVLNFCGDSTHMMANQAVPLPELPLEYRG